MCVHRNHEGAERRRGGKRVTRALLKLAFCLLFHNALNVDVHIGNPVSTSLAARESGARRSSFCLCLQKLQRPKSLQQKLSFKATKKKT